LQHAQSVEINGNGMLDQLPVELIGEPQPTSPTSPTHLAELRHGQPRADDPADRALLLARKADLLIGSRIAAQHTPTDPSYAEHVPAASEAPPRTAEVSGWSSR